MPTAVNSILPVVSAQGVASEVAFQPGSTIAGRVLSVSPDNQARIAIGHSTIDVQSQVPLQAGQVLQFAVSKTDDGNVRLAVVTPQPTTTGQATGTQAGNVTLAPDLPINLANVIASSKIQLTSLEAQAVSTATQTAVTQQASLATLFADLGAVTSLQGLPQPLQQAVAQVLAQRPPLDAKLTGDEVKSAFQQSGLFLEASLAKGALPQGAVPDMKAALIVLRQVLTATLSTTSSAMAATLAPEQGDAMPVNPQPAAFTPATMQQAQTAAAAVLVPSLLAKAVRSDPSPPVEPVATDDMAEIAAPVAVAPVAAKTPETAARAAPNGTMLSMLQEALQGNPKGVGGMAAQMLDEAMAPDLAPYAKAAMTPSGAAAILPHSAVPPPLRGALPTAQPMLPSQLPANAPLGTVAHRLLADTDAALARQTLLQVASLPDRADTSAMPRLDQATARWNFEIPFAMPNGTAVAQFEIARDDGAGSEVEAAQRVWRARFSLDVEPAGPVHALISLTGDKTSVRMWAERAGTARQLQAGSAQLTQALVRANLQPGDIVIREGAPVQPAPAAAGHFLDRAL
ncbi:MAG: flagellar hook-length control protein FliK [Tardiphaga sp.]